MKLIYIHFFVLFIVFSFSHDFKTNKFQLFYLFSANIEARIKNEVIFKIYVSGLLKNVFTFNPTWLEGRVPVAPNYWEYVECFPKQGPPRMLNLPFLRNLVVCSGF